MKYTTATASLLALTASTTLAQDSTRAGKFQIATFNITGQDIPGQGVVDCKTIPVITLKDGVLLDQSGRTGEIVANRQFQFDNPVQGPTTSGFGIYSNGSLAINGNAVFYSCNSGSFANLYDQSIASYCVPIYIVTYPCAGSGASIETGGATSATSSATSSSTLVTSTTSLSSASSASTTYTVATTSAYMPIAPPPVISSPAAPYPAGNSTTPAGTASASVVPTTTTSSAPGTTTSAATFPGAASTTSVGGGLVAFLAGLAAFALI